MKPPSPRAPPPKKKNLYTKKEKLCSSGNKQRSKKMSLARVRLSQNFLILFFCFGNFGFYPLIIFIYINVVIVIQWGWFGVGVGIKRGFRLSHCMLTGKTHMGLITANLVSYRSKTYQLCIWTFVTPTPHSLDPTTPAKYQLT